MTSKLMQGDRVISWRNIRIRVNPGEVHGYYVYLFGDYSGVEVDCVIRLCRQGRVFFDVGANQGWMSVVVAKHCPEVRVVGFEPDPKIAERMLETIQLNPEIAERVLARRHAIGATDGEVEFAPSTLENLGTGRLVDGKHDQSFRVECRTVDSVCEELGIRPDVIKIDIEGGELDALRGMTSLLRLHPPAALVMELHGFAVDDRVSFYDEIRSRLVSAGYRLFVLGQPSFTEAGPTEDWPSRLHVAALQSNGLSLVSDLL
jgi:FkbM family methyltransferase